MLSLAALLFALAFSDTVTCAVEGDIFHDSAAEPITYTPGNFCMGIRVTTDESQLVMYSPNRWVTVKIAVDKGHRRFIYIWGHDVAHLGPDTIPIVWGPVGQG